MGEIGDFRIADAYALQAQARAAGKLVVENDGLHPNYEGQRCIARSILDAMGFANVAVPAIQQLKLYPGVITEWQIKPVADGKALDEKTVAALTIDDTWVAYKLPETEKIDSVWLEGERQRGFAVSLSKIIGKAKRYYGTATIEAENPREVSLNTGAGLQTVWLNGKRLYKSTEYTGWHAGKERLPAKLQTGKNLIVIEANENFFLSVTDERDW